MPLNLRQFLSHNFVYLSAGLNLLLLLALTQISKAQPNWNTPSTVSPEWTVFLQGFSDPALLPAFPKPDDSLSWRKLQESAEKRGVQRSLPAIEKYRPVIKEDTLDNVPVLDIRPSGWKDNGKVLIYLHGGAFTLLSPRSTLNISALVADRSGLRTLAIAYTLAPEGNWESIGRQVLAVYQALLKMGIKPEDIAFFGDSAGGGLVAACILRMRDQGLPLPAAAVLWSPWTDLTESGDSYYLMAGHDPLLSYENILKPSALAYADSINHRNPYVSAVYGDFSKGFPPTLIQGGTREILLSNFVRLYQAIEQGGQNATLDLYEGMVHNFPAQLPDSPEAQLALKKLSEFLHEHLKY